MQALQCIKCAIRHDLLFREPAPSSTIELEEDHDEDLELVDVARGDSESRDAEELYVEDEDDPEEIVH